MPESTSQYLAVGNLDAEYVGLKSIDINGDPLPVAIEGPEIVFNIGEALGARIANHRLELVNGEKLAALDVSDADHVALSLCDTDLVCDGVGILSQRDPVNLETPQTFRIAAQYDPLGIQDFLALGADGDDFSIKTAATGTDARALNIDASEILLQIGGITTVDVKNTGVEINGELTLQLPSSITAAIKDYEYGVKWEQTGPSPAERIEFYLGTETADWAKQPNFSVRTAAYSGGLGAKIEARNGADTDAIMMRWFKDTDDTVRTEVRWANGGPSFVNYDPNTLIMRCVETPTNPMRLWIASKYTPGSVREYLSFGIEDTNQFSIKVCAFGGGTQRMLKLDAALYQWQIGSTMKWQLTGDGNGRIQFGGSSAAYPALTYNGSTLQTICADGSSFAFHQAKLTTDTAYVAGAPIATGYLLFYDANGTAYEVPAKEH